MSSPDSAISRRKLVGTFGAGLAAAATPSTTTASQDASYTTGNIYGAGVAKVNRSLQALRR